MSALHDSLRDAPLPGEAEAAARSWPVVDAALAERTRSRPARGGARSLRRASRVALVAALAAAGLAAAALSPAGAWIGDRFAGDSDETAPAFAALPKGGSVLALSRTGAYAIDADGSTQRLGSFSDAGWSPRGRHAVGVKGRRLTAVTPVGTVKWTLARPTRLHDPAWSMGEGYAVAYLEGSSLRVVAGDGDPSSDRLLRRAAAPVRPAWHPESDRVLTYATVSGAIETVDIESAATLWRAPVSAHSLQWSRDGRRLVAVSGRRVIVLDRSGRILRTLPLSGVAREFALHPSGTHAAVVVRGRVVDVRLDAPRERQLFQGTVDGLAWSEDGRTLLMSWRDTGQWLLLGPGDRIRSMQGVSRELGARDGFPRVAGWCCGDG
ncbi:MAG: hypothetical protein QOE69_786 [Thermoleophilaceae bacterium]|jgi:hypothetical protein|nr:hypothetical protein [Thermoleophilaceae bacterium]